jgi:hypothetical protein
MKYIAKGTNEGVLIGQVRDYSKLDIPIMKIIVCSFDVDRYMEKNDDIYWNTKNEILMVQDFLRCPNERAAIQNYFELEIY